MAPVHSALKERNYSKNVWKGQIWTFWNKPDSYGF